MIYVSYSGGKDSTALLYLVREMYPEIPGVYVDTGLEYPEIKAFVRRQENIVTVRPKKDFRQVIMQYGYPFISKEVADCVYGARRYLDKLEERERGTGQGGTVPNHSCMADMIGVDRRDDKENTVYQSLKRGEIAGADKRVPVRYLILQG